MSKITTIFFTKAIIFVAIIISTNIFADNKQSQELMDARLETQIWTTYTLSPYLRNNNLTVTVHEGKAIIKGNVAEDVDKDLAQQMALGVKGINKVDNKILVAHDYEPPKSNDQDRSYGQIIDDISITALIKSKLLWSKHSEGLATDVDTLFGKVTLTGTAINGAAKELAGQFAKNTHGVNSVNNKIMIKTEDTTEEMSEKVKPKIINEPEKAVSDMGDKVSDSWITAKVKTTLIYSKNISSYNISVDTKDGKVTLSGQVSNAAERDLAIELAQNIRGVQSVQANDLNF